MPSARTFAAVCLAAVVGLGATAWAQEPPPIDEPVDPGKGAPPPGILETSKSPTEVSGSYVLDSSSDTALFRSVDKGNQVVQVGVQLHGMTLVATIDFAAQTAQFKGFATDTKTETPIREEDSALLAALSKKLQSSFDGATATLAEQALVKAVSVWEEWPAATSPIVTIGGSSLGFGIYMLCGQARCKVRTPSGALVWSYTGNCAQWNWTLYAEHDCNQCNFGQPRCQQIAQLGDHARCNGDEYYWNGSAWLCGEPNHWVRPYVTGNCFGACGAGCGSGRQYTLNCMDHDGCVRNGHSLISWWCDDQFVAAIDDAFFAPNCY
jgi:hypothetical protein